MSETAKTHKDLLKALIDPIRWYWYPFVMTSIGVAFIIGLVVPMDHETASSMVKEIEGMRTTMSSYPSLLLNNLVGVLTMMIPFLGFPYALFTAFLNGNYSLAFATVSGSNPLVVGTNMLLTPSGVIQFIAFALSANESLVLNNAFFSKRIRQEARVAAVILCAVIILIAAGLAIGIAFEA